MDGETIARLEARSRERLSSLRADLVETLTPITSGAPTPDVCIYATGSLARLEANDSSDLDAFFLLSGNGQDHPLGRIRDIRILNTVISATERNGFPDFSNEGEFLSFIHIEDLIEHIGDREDDYHNMLTARMLLILESTYLFNEDLYHEMRSSIIGRYFSDFHKHNRNFKPIFLLNDVLRFWRTVCLNYENGRQWRTTDRQKNAKGHLANLKLRFSRLNICFTFIAKLLAIGPSVELAQVLEVCEVTPLERLRIIQSHKVNLKIDIDTLLREYDWFLDSVSRPKDDVLNWISDKASREEAFSHSDIFTNTMYKVVSAIAEEHDYLRYLVI